MHLRIPPDIAEPPFTGRSPPRQRAVSPPQRAAAGAGGAALAQPPEPEPDRLRDLFERLLRLKDEMERSLRSPAQRGD
jgi:hypothetical protein